MDIRVQLTDFQAKAIGRLLEPERIAWKAFFDSWLSMPLTAEQILNIPPQQQHIWQLGRYLLFSSFSTPVLMRWVLKPTLMPSIIRRS